MEVRGIEDDGSPPLLIPPARENAGCINAVRELLTATFPNSRLFNGENLLCDDDDYTLLVESLLSGLFRRFVLGDADTRPPLLRRLRQLLHQRHGRPLSVAELARHCNYSPGHLSELIRRECGETAKTMIDRERASMARHYLEFSDMNIGEIAAHMGFASLFAFSGFFRLHHNCSPRAFRAACRAGLKPDSGPAIQNP
ncbi:helix-turn-helix transcriptional regulator [uncultured Victivallis sp.]|nr:helix-turn-helix transcriptional regulator [uncultured Victivallis sp.]